MKANSHIERTRPIRRSAGALGVVALVGGWIGLVGCSRESEHPAEHPTRARQKAESKSDVTLGDVTTYIEGYVKDKSKDGLFKVADKSAKKDLSLKLDKIHRERLSRVGPDTSFVCADFKTPDAKKVYDLDFFVQGASKDKLAVLEDKTSVHKEDGKARYTWTLNEKTGIWEQKPVGAAPPKEAATKKAEHPEHPQ